MDRWYVFACERCLNRGVMEGDVGRLCWEEAQNYS